MFLTECDYPVYEVMKGMVLMDKLVALFSNPFTFLRLRKVFLREGNALILITIPYQMHMVGKEILETRHIAG